jgi:predicted RNA binding protein YcfA (HicA-like mRNA interferase family)
MRLPRDLSGEDLVKKLRPFGYVATRQTGNHIRLTRSSPKGEHHVTVPRHRALRVGTLNSVLAEVAAHLGLEKTELVRRL